MDPRLLYGTDQPPPSRRRLVAGKASVTLEGGQLRHLRIGEAEAIRAVSFLVRDRDWGTVEPEIADLKVEAGDQTHVSYRARYKIGAALLEARIALCLGPDSLVAEAVARAHGSVETNRAGFTVLHPIDDVAGAAVRVDHADGSVEEGHFPGLIEPWQPFKDIVALTHLASGLKIECCFEGDVFEMEDQRQWGDASYKTYNRPLALPWPYSIGDGDEIRQAVRVSWSQAAVPATVARRAGQAEGGGVFPETALLLTASQAREALGRPDDLRRIAPQRLLCHLDSSIGQGLRELRDFAALQAALPDPRYDLELIATCPPEGDLASEFEGHARNLSASGLVPASIMVCPAVDRQSTPPGSAWPPCPPLADIHAVARAAFAGQVMGGGMASFFPELNRKQPPVDMLDFVSHGLCPIVHAADDLSVMETLEAVPHILTSARAIIGAGEYRLGPSTIAMRQNPYGSRTIPNPGRQRICMTDDDPRQDGAFAAAWTLGLAASIAKAGVTVWTPAELYGPRGLIRADGSLRPVAAVVQALARLAGQKVGVAGVRDGLARLEVCGTALIANLAPDARHGLPPFGWQTVPASSRS